jgi:hypothetical protein
VRHPTQPHCVGFLGTRYRDSRWAGGLRLTARPPEALRGPSQRVYARKVGVTSSDALMALSGALQPLGKQPKDFNHISWR